MSSAVNPGSIVSWLFGMVVVAIGLVNTGWGNDPGFGVFLLLLSTVYFLPINSMLRERTGLSIPKMTVVKIALGLFILWAALGVGELFDKIDQMLKDL